MQDVAFGETLLLALTWFLGGSWLLSRRRPAAAAALLLLAVWTVAAVLLGGVGPSTAAQWWGVAWLGVVARPASRHEGSPIGPSLLPLLSIGWQSLGALTAAVVLLGAGALERGRRGRPWLAGGLVSFGLAGALDAWSLQAWLQVRALFSLSQDAASAMVDGGELGLRVLAWALLVGWAGRRRTAAR